jgi:hypothetical protein
MGRPKGSPNKVQKLARDIAQQMGVDPLKILLHFAAGDWEGLGYKQGHKLTQFGEQDVISPELRLSAAREAVRYVYPALKQVDLANKDDDGFRVEIVDFGGK